MNRGGRGELMEHSNLIAYLEPTDLKPRCQVRGEFAYSTERLIRFHISFLGVSASGEYLKTPSNSLFLFGNLYMCLYYILTMHRVVTFIYG